METIDLTPTPLEYARIAQRMIEGAYGLDAPAGHRAPKSVSHPIGCETAALPVGLADATSVEDFGQKCRRLRTSTSARDLAMSDVPFRVFTRNPVWGSLNET